MKQQVYEEALKAIEKAARDYREALDEEPGSFKNTAELLLEDIEQVARKALGK